MEGTVVSETITGQSGGIRLTNPATQNPLTVTGTGNIYAAGYNPTGYQPILYGVFGLYHPWTINNQGSISCPNRDSEGIYLTDGGTIFNGDLYNPAASITGSLYGIHIAGAPGTIINWGGVAGVGRGIGLSNGGTILNYSSGVISSSGFGIIAGTASTIINDGTVEGGVGIQLGAGSTLLNAGLIKATNNYLYGVSFAGNADH